MESKLILHHVDNENWKIEFVNVVDETVEFPDPVPPELKKLMIECGNVTYINSAGLFRWVRWLNSLKKQKPSLDIEFYQLPASFIRAQEMSSEVIPASSIVASFYYDYFCPQCGSSKHILTPNSAITRQVNESCKECGSAMELELEPKSYEAICRRAPKGKQ